MEDDEHSGKIVEVHINLNGQPFVEDIDNNEHELQSGDLKEQENEEVDQSSLNSEINLDTLPSMHVHFLREPPSVIDNEDLNAASNVEGQSGVCVVSHPVCGSAVLLSETISMSSANLSGIPVVLTTPVLSGLCTATSGNIEGLHVDDDQHGSLLNITKSEAEETQEMDDSCIGLTASDSVITTVTDKVTQTVPVESIVVTTHQTSMCYLRQIFDHDQVTSQGQMPTLAHGVTSHNLPELKQCKWQGCCKHFLSLEDLVQHVNEFHIRTDKHSEFCCHWKGCNRNGKGFNARYKMLIHMRTHTGEKPHKCHHEDCGKSFSRLENLKIHQRSHTGERPYTCPIEGCDKRYSNSSDRFKHTRTHYERKPYHCRIEGCEKCYTDPSSLRKHLKTHHGQDVNIEEQE